MAVRWERVTVIPVPIFSRVSHLTTLNTETKIVEKRVYLAFQVKRYEMVKGLHSQNRPCLRLAQTQRAHRSIMCDIPRMVPPTSGSLTSRRHRPLLSFLPCRNQFRHCAALPARGGRSDGISKRYAEYRALNFLGRHVMASTPLDGGSFEKASLEKRLPWNILPHFARSLAWAQSFFQPAPSRDVDPI